MAGAPGQRISVEMIGEQQHIPAPQAQIAELSSDAALQPSPRVVVGEQHKLPSVTT